MLGLVKKIIDQRQRSKDRSFSDRTIYLTDLFYYRFIEENKGSNKFLSKSEEFLILRFKRSSTDVEKLIFDLCEYEYKIPKDDN